MYHVWDFQILNDVLAAKHQQLETIQNWAGLNNSSHMDAASGAIFWTEKTGVIRILVLGCKDVEMCGFLLILVWIHRVAIKDKYGVQKKQNFGPKRSPIC